MSKNNENNTSTPLTSASLKTSSAGLVPRLRFPEFTKDGEWQSNRFGNVYYFIVTNSFSRDDLNYVNGEVKNIHYGDIHTKFSTLFDITKENVPFINESIPLDKFKKENYCKEGDMIFADASEDLKNVGKSIEVVNLNNEKLLSGLHSLLARQINSEFVIGFGGYLFLNDRIRKQIKRESQGAKVLGISATRLSSINIFYPIERNEQQKIASCLSSLDEVITAESQKLDILQDHKQGLLQILFPQEGETVPKYRFLEFEDSGDWRPKVIGEFTNERTEIAEEKLPLYSLTIENGITPKSDRYERSFLVRDEGNAYKVVYYGDFAYNPMNLRFGAIARHSGKLKVAVSKYYNIFNCDNSVDSLFCSFYFKSCKMIALYDDIATGSLIEKRRVHFSSFVNLKVLLPTKEEQQKIASCLSSIDDLINAQSQKIEALKLHKKGLLQGLFPDVNPSISMGLETESKLTT